jgi:hypothetical protein
VALACWCGTSASIGAVRIQAPRASFDQCPATWEPEQVRLWAKWMTALSAALPAGAELESFDGIARIQGPSQSREVRWDGDFGLLLAAVAPPSTSPTPVTIWTIQAFAARSASAAARVADQLAEVDVDPGFLIVGGFPGRSELAHVVRHGPLFRVQLGAYLYPAMLAAPLDASPS